MQRELFEFLDGFPLFDSCQALKKRVTVDLIAWLTPYAATVHHVRTLAIVCCRKGIEFILTYIEAAKPYIIYQTVIQELAKSLRLALLSEMDTRLIYLYEPTLLGSAPPRSLAVSEVGALDFMIDLGLSTRVSIMRIFIDKHEDWVGPILLAVSHDVLEWAKDPANKHQRRYLGGPFLRFCAAMVRPDDEIPFSFFQDIRQLANLSQSNLFDLATRVAEPEMRDFAWELV